MVVIDGEGDIDHDGGVIARYDTCEEGRQMRAQVFMIAIVTLAVSNCIAFAGPFEDAKAVYDRGDYPTALQLFVTLARKGNAAAQTQIGWIV